MRAKIEVHHFFSNSTPQFGSLRPLPKTDLEKIKLIPDEKSHGSGIQRESRKKNGRFSAILG